MDWVEGSAQPTVEGWPAEGQTVTWRAHVKSWFASPQHVGYRWMLDGAEAARGALDIAGGAEATADFAWPWTFERHQLAFEIDPDGAIAEEEEQLRARSGPDGIVSLGRDPFAAAGGVVFKETYNGTLLIRAERDGVSWFFLTAAEAIEAAAAGAPVARTLR